MAAMTNPNRQSLSTTDEVADVADSETAESHIRAEWWAQTAGTGTTRAVIIGVLTTTYTTPADVAEKVANDFQKANQTVADLYAQLNLALNRVLTTEQEIVNTARKHRRPGQPFRGQIRI